MINKITLEEFRKLVDKQNDEISIFDIFEFKCKKCGSNNIEVFGSYQVEKINIMGVLNIWMERL